MWLRVAVVIVVVLGACIAVIAFVGSRRWEAETGDLRSRLEAARAPGRPRAFNARDLDGLPAPVQRYFRIALTDGQPMVAAASLEHAGTFSASETAVQWKPFTSKQRVVTRPPGFDWDARIAMMPGMAVYVHDAYVAGEGILHAALFGLITVANVRGTPEAAQGELMRYFAEMVWYPTALLPSQGVRWEAVDDASSKATFQDGDLKLTLLFRFGDAGLVDSVLARARGRVVGGAVVPSPWQARVWRYEARDGMRVPMEGEVAWLLADGPRPYWRGSITALSYEFEK